MISTPPQATAPENPSANKEPIELDKASSFIAEVNVPMDKLGSKLRKIAKFDTHSKWSDAYIRETLTAASLLQKNDRLQGEMLATLEKESALIEVNIIRVDQDKYAVRVVSSFQKLSDAINTELQAD